LSRFTIIGTAVSTILIIGILNVTDVFGKEASREQVAIVQAQTKTEKGETGGTYARVTVERLNVRAKPDLSASVIQSVEKSSRYEVLDKQDDWVKIRLSDKKSGWVFGSYIQYENAGPKILNRETVAQMIEKTNLRSGPGTDFSIAAKAKPGETYPIIATNGDWYAVLLPGKSKSTAYVASWIVKTDFLKRNASLISAVNTKDLKFAPQIYIYHTHNRESWKNVARDTSGTKVDDMEENITLVGKRLGQLLQDQGISALSGNDDFTGRLKQENLTFAQSYKLSRKAVDKARTTYPSLSYFFDIHRDANISRDKTTTIIEGKAYARIMFVIGTAHAAYEENKAFAEVMDALLNEKYPGLSRGVLTKSAQQGDGEYNQSFSPGSLLLEIGGTNNTLQESLNTAEAFADVFATYYRSVK